MTTTGGAIGRLAELIRDNQPCVALTGAGISQESGIPTFRGPDYVSEKVRDKTNLSTDSGSTGARLVRDRPVPPYAGSSSAGDITFWAVNSPLATVYSVPVPGAISRRAIV